MFCWPGKLIPEGHSRKWDTGYLESSLSKDVLWPFTGSRTWLWRSWKGLTTVKGFWSYNQKSKVKSHRAEAVLPHIGLCDSASALSLNTWLLHFIPRRPSHSAVPAMLLETVARMQDCCVPQLQGFSCVHAALPRRGIMAGLQRTKLLIFSCHYSSEGIRWV